MSNPLTDAGTCSRCGNRFDDPVHPGLIVYEIDAEAGNYGEQGWVTSPVSEVSISCQHPVTDYSGTHTCLGWIDLDLQETLAAAFALYNQQIRREIGT